MGMAAKSVIRPKSFEQAFVPLTAGDYTCNLVIIGPVVFENATDDAGRHRLPVQ